MNRAAGRETLRRRCAIYTRKSSEEGLEQEFNSLQAQREACEAFIRSQRSEGWLASPETYDHGDCWTCSHRTTNLPDSNRNSSRGADAGRRLGANEAP